MCASAGGRHHIVDFILDFIPPQSASEISGNLGSNPSYVGAVLASGEDAAVMAAANGFTDLASKLTRRLYLGKRTRKLCYTAGLLPPSAAAFS
jgi:hypothetical protein